MRWSAGRPRPATRDAEGDGPVALPAKFWRIPEAVARRKKTGEGAGHDFRNRRAGEARCWWGV